MRTAKPVSPSPKGSSRNPFRAEDTAADFPEKQERALDPVTRAWAWETFLFQLPRAEQQGQGTFRGIAQTHLHCFSADLIAQIAYFFDAQGKLSAAARVLVPSEGFDQGTVGAFEDVWLRDLLVGSEVFDVHRKPCHMQGKGMPGRGRIW